MKKSHIAFVVIFCALMLLPFTLQTITDMRDYFNAGESDKSGMRLLSLDIFKDTFYTPFKRESRMVDGARKLKDAWNEARKDSEKLESVTSALLDLEATTFTVNTYAELDSLDEDRTLLLRADTLLNEYGDDPESADAKVVASLDSCVNVIAERFGSFSALRALAGIKLYGAWQGTYLRAFEHEVENENALVLAVRPKYQLAEWKLLSEPGEKVVLGAYVQDSACVANENCASDRWLFYRQDVEFLVQPSPLDMRSKKLDNPIEAISTFRDQLKKRGIELLVVVVPGKPSIYPERLTGNDLVGDALADGSYVGNGKLILDSLAGLGFNTVDLYTPLRKAKAGDGEFGALYLNDDTHWTPRGAELAAGVIAAKVQSMVDSGLVDIGADSVEYVASDSVALRMGDIGEMSGLNKFNVFQVQPVVGHVVADASGAPFKDDFRKSKILILGDSFSRIYQTDSPVNAGWISHFAKDIKRPVSSIVSDGGASTLVREKLARKANVLKGKKLLIWEFVERDLRFGAEGWKNVNL